MSLVTEQQTEATVQSWWGQTAHKEGIELPHATARLHRRTLDRIIEDTPAHDNVQGTKTEDIFSFNTDSVIVQEVEFGGGMVFPFCGFLQPYIDYY